jgi:uncharacterized protein with PQ loop repeat
MVDAIHHLHSRKRIHENLEEYPHPDKLKNIMDRLIYFVALFSVVMTLPQLAEIWINKNAIGVSILSWSAYTIASSFWCFYGIVHKEKPIIYTYAVASVLYCFIVVGILIYG